MARIPTPRTPRCLKHHRWMAGCTDCTEQHAAEQAAALVRLAEQRRTAAVHP